MKKSDFYKRVARDIKLKRPDISVVKNKGHRGETLWLTVYKQLEPQRTNSLNKIKLKCNRNIVTIVEYDNSKKLISTLDYSYNEINMIALTADTVIEKVK